ncbi:hypothetical protein O3Q52_47735, partial [Streptomyces sp. ActVer]|nr:hypothetical protein [Streptomyces sp. ActVer]
MGNDIEIRVRVANQTAGGLTSFNQSMQRVKDNARDAGRAVDGLSARAVAAAAGVRTLDSAVQDLNRSLRTLRGRAAAADASLRDLRDASTNSSNSLRGLNTRAQTSATRLGDLSDRTRTLRSDSDDLDGSMRRLTGTLGGLRGNLGTVRMSTSGASGGMQNLRKAALLLAPALIPIAAQAAPIAASLGAAGVAVGVFGLALGGQVAVMAKASAAEKKYRDTVEEHGKASEEAVKAEADYLRQVRQMDPATRRAAAAFTVFKDQYKQWSSSLAGDTMPVVTKGLATFGALLPKLSPLVRGTSEQLDRLMAVAAGGIQSAGFERFMQSFSEFASGALSRATLGLVKFSQALDAGKVGGGLHEFMQFVRETGPLVGETLRNLGQALGNLVVAASDAGVGILTAVNALAKLVNAVPAEALSAFVQLYATLKLVRLGIAGVSAVATAGAVANLTGFVRAARFAGVGSAIAGVTQRMSTLQKVGGSLGVLGVAALAIDALADKARGAPPDLDKMSASLKALAVTGKFTGELKSTFGDMDGFTAKLGKLKSESAAMEKVKPYLAFSGLGAFADTAVTKLDDLVRGTKSLGATKDDFKVFDEGFADLAKNGYADEAAEQFKVFETAMRKANWSTKDINSVFGKYKETVGGLKDVQDLAAKGMGAFGAQAISVQQKLDAQQKSVAGLQQSLHALNNTYLESRGGVRAMEEAIDAASEAIKKNGRTLDDDTAAGRANNAALDAIASSTMKAMEAKYQETGSWEAAMKVYDRGRSALDKATLSATGNKESARALADQLLKMPDKKMRLEMDRSDAEAGLNAFNAAVKRTPGAKSVTLK